MSAPRLPSVMFIIKFCSVAVAIAAIVFAQLGPGDWQPRTGLGWQTEHVLAYFVVTSIVCLVWPRPFVVGPALMAASVLLEALQALTPDRHVNFLAGLYGAGGALAAALLAELFIRVWRWRTPLKTVKIAGALAVVAFAVLSLVPWQLRPHTGAPESPEHVAADAVAGGLLTFGYGKGEVGPPGPAGPPGRPGPPGPPGPAASGAAIRVIKAPCDQTACGATCMENEQILNAYALNPGGVISFIDERNVSFRPKQSGLQFSCSLALRWPSLPPQSRGGAAVPATAPRRRRRFPSKIGRASPLPPPSCQILPRLRSSEAVRCRNRRPKDGATRPCPTSRWKSTSAWPDRVQRTSLTASDKAS